MLTAKHLPGLLAILLLTSAPGCFSRSQDSPQASSASPASPTQTSTAASPVEPATPSPESESEPSQAVPPQAAPEPTAPTASSSAPDTTSAQASAPSADCANAQTQAEINQCAQASYETADKELNRVYQELKSSLNNQEQEELIDAELAWIEYRDQTCEAESSQYEGGSIQPTIYYGCLERVTTERTAELQSQLEQS
ncbi:DUF1311 domain-containing protein [Cyanobacteria bacterium FACHB-471]|nr:DUF1311 domain-containing protein [Cyanobacteria bacterium FACHB-471]